MSKSNNLLTYTVKQQNFRDMTPLKRASDNEKNRAYKLDYKATFGSFSEIINTSQSKLCKDFGLNQKRNAIKALLKVKKNSKPCWETKLT